MDEVIRDIDYYAVSGGGITLSGGEPMLQIGFSTALAAEAKRRNIHVCLDTSGFAPTSHFEKIAPFIDLYLFDYKETDPMKHIAATGVSNDLILANLDFLYRRGASIILRCPLIPGVNDSAEHLNGIAALVKQYPRIAGVQVMAYHDMGVHKAERIGVHAPLAHLKTVDEATKAKWIYTLRTLLQQHELAPILLEIG